MDHAAAVAELKERARNNRKSPAATAPVQTPPTPREGGAAVVGGGWLPRPFLIEYNPDILLAEAYFKRARQVHAAALAAADPEEQAEFSALSTELRDRGEAIFDRLECLFEEDK